MRNETPSTCAPKLLALVALTTLAGACTTEPAGARGFPADVAAVLEDNCVRCHAASPRFGAPMSLATWDALHTSSVTVPGTEVFSLAGVRIHDPARPMPPGDPLEPSDLSVLDAWIEAGAPPGDGPTLLEAPPVLVGPEHLPCEPTAEFRAFAPGTTEAPFALEGGGNQVLCFAFASPFGDATQGTAFAPIIDDDRVLHHWIIFGTDALPAGTAPGDVWECGTSGLGSASQFLTGWAPGGVNSVLPPDQGRELPGPTGFVVLQVHYWNVAAHTDVLDRSGVAVCTTETPREHEIGTSILGSLDIAIPPRARGHEVVGTCTPDLTEPVTIVASGPHMHMRGVSIRTEIIRAGAPAGATEMLMEVPDWDFNTQTGVPAPGGATVVMPGDSLRTTCVFDNEGDATAYFGENTEDEMCFNFVSAYPAGALTTAAGRSRRLCID